MRISFNFSTMNSVIKATVQKQAPSFRGQAVVDGQFKEVSLTDYKGATKSFLTLSRQMACSVLLPNGLVRMTILTCSTFVCPTEILAFNASIEAFKSINTELLAVSTDSEFSHLAWYAESCNC